MIEQSMNLILGANFILLIGLVWGLLSWQKKHGRLTANKVAVIITGYFSFVFVTTLSPLLIISPNVTILVDLICLTILWLIGYPLFRWIYSQFVS